MKLCLIFYVLFCLKFCDAGGTFEQIYLKVSNVKPLDSVYNDNVIETINLKNKLFCMKKCNELVDCQIIILKDSMCFLFPRIDLSPNQSPSDNLLIYTKNKESILAEKNEIENITEINCGIFICLFNK